jgi:hypothetical protein
VGASGLDINELHTPVMARNLAEVEFNYSIDLLNIAFIFFLMMSDKLDKNDRDSPQLGLVGASSFPSGLRAASTRKPPEKGAQCLMARRCEV